MPITTAGSSGTVTGNYTNSTATSGAIGSGSIAVFTTPNTTNAIFLVNYQIVASTANTSNIANTVIAVPGAVGYSNSGQVGNSVGLRLDGTNENSSASGSFKCGPNTNLTLAVSCKNGASASAGTFGYRVHYDYVSIVIS